MNFQQTDEWMAWELTQEALARVNDGDSDAALRKLEVAARLDPASDNIQYNLGYVEWIRGNFVRSQQLLAPLALHASDPAVKANSQIYLGNIAYDSGDLDEALEHFAEAGNVTFPLRNLSAIRAQSDSLCGRGMVEKSRGNLEAARRLLAGASELCPTNVAALSHLAHCYYEAEDFEQAIGVGERMLELALQNPNLEPIGDMWMQLGTYYEAVDDIEKAIECYERADELGEENARQWIEDLKSDQTADQTQRLSGADKGL